MTADTRWGTTPGMLWIPIGGAFGMAIMYLSMGQVPIRAASLSSLGYCLGCSAASREGSSLLSRSASARSRSSWRGCSGRRRSSVEDAEARYSGMRPYQRSLARLPSRRWRHPYHQEEAREAQSMGWRTFRILTPDQKPVSTETLCRNVRTGTAHQVCGLCRGTTLRAKHVAMPQHGSKRVHFYRNIEIGGR
jgi:hypothetical protein